MLTMRLFRNVRRFAVCLLMLCCIGCVRKTTVEGATVYSIELWATALTAIGSAVVIAYGIYLRQQSWKGWLAVAVGIGGLVVAVPSIALDRTIVDARHFETRHGVWFVPSVQNVHFDNLASVSLQEKVTWRKGRKRISHELQCQMKDGSTTQVPLGDVMKEAAAEILQRVRERNIPVGGVNP